MEHIKDEVRGFSALQFPWDCAIPGERANRESLHE